MLSILSLAMKCVMEMPEKRINAIDIVTKIFNLILLCACLVNYHVLLSSSPVASPIWFCIVFVSLLNPS